MLKPVSEWDEAYILSLPKENDKFDRKGALKLDLIAGANPDAVLDELAKQLSAFANMGGGQIIYGLKDDGTVDSGGVSTQVKNGTKEWLERQIPGLTEYEIPGFVVHEFGPKGRGSQIQAGKALYVVDVPDSDRAPHQSTRDRKYYVRLGSQSQPAPHKMIEDIRNRQKHPNVLLMEATTEDTEANPVREDLYFCVLDAALRIVLANVGSLKSTDTFLLLHPQQGSFTFSLDKEIATGVTGTQKGNYQWQLNRPFPPQAEVSFRAQYHVPARFNPHPQFRKWFNDEENIPFEDIAIEWTVFADSAPPKKGTITLATLNLIATLDMALRRNRGF